MTGVLFPAQREKMEIQLMPWHSMMEPPILAWSYPATHSELLNLSRKKKHKARCKIRVILMPIWHDRMGELERAADLPSRIKEEIEQFFTSATFFQVRS